jgi:Holliday junction DNA helicase RuvA
MIGYLRGKVVDVHGSEVVLDVNGVGYLLGVSAAAAAKLSVGDETAMEVYMQVGEKVLALFGFVNRTEKEFFQQLLKVDGVGPTTALAVLGAGELDDVKVAIASNDADYFKKVRGVGPSTLRKISIDLAPKLKLEVGSKPIRKGMEATVETTLLGLGFKPDQVQKGLAAVDWASKPDAKTAMTAALAVLRQ